MNYVKSCVFISMLAGVAYNTCHGDMNFDLQYNILDIVAMSNCILENNCLNIWAYDPEFEAPLCYPADMNIDGNYNILDIVILANCVLAANCPEIGE